MESPTCCIQWIDSEGKPTPDTNEAVMIAQFHKPIHAYLTGETLAYSSEIQESFPICAAHYAQVTPKMRFGNGGGWSFCGVSQ